MLAGAPKLNPPGLGAVAAGASVGFDAVLEDAAGGAPNETAGLAEVADPAAGVDVPGAVPKAGVGADVVAGLGGAPKLNPPAGFGASPEAGVGAVAGLFKKDIAPAGAAAAGGADVVGAEVADAGGSAGFDAAAGGAPKENPVGLAVGVEEDGFEALLAGAAPKEKPPLEGAPAVAG